MQPNQLDDIKKHHASGMLHPKPVHPDQQAHQWLGPGNTSIPTRGVYLKVQPLKSLQQSEGASLLNAPKTVPIHS